MISSHIQENVEFTFKPYSSINNFLESTSADNSALTSPPIPHCKIIAKVYNISQLSNYSLHYQHSKRRKRDAK